MRRIHGSRHVRCHTAAAPPWNAHDPSCFTSRRLPASALPIQQLSAVLLLTARHSVPFSRQLPAPPPRPCLTAYFESPLQVIQCDPGPLPSFVSRVYTDDSYQVPEVYWPIGCLDIEHGQVPMGSPYVISVSCNCALIWCWFCFLQFCSDVAAPLHSCREQSWS